MAQVFRPTYHIAPPADATYFMKDGIQHAKFRMRKSGRLVSGPVRPNGDVSVRSEYYYCHIKEGGKKKRKALHVTDKEAALQLRAKLVKDSDRRAAGLDDPKIAHAATPLSRHVQDYQFHMQASGFSKDHIKESIAILDRILYCTNCRVIPDIGPASVSHYLNLMIKAGKSRRTRNKYLKTLRTFIKWLIQVDRTDTDPTRSIATLNEQSDPKRRLRRALTPMELTALVQAAASGKVVRCVKGPERALIYTMAVTTGLRASELSDLRVRDLHLDDPTPFLVASTEITKNEQEAIQPLHPLLVPKLQAHIAGKTKADYLFDLKNPNGDTRDTEVMMKKDCKAAGIPYKTADGFADFHALRHTFAAQVCRLTDSFAATTIIRHASPTTTARYYDKVALEYKAQVINQLAI